MRRLGACAFLMMLAATAALQSFIEQHRLTGSDGMAGDLFGVSVAIDDETMVIGAALDDVDGTVDRGSAYVFVRPAGGWSAGAIEVARLTASDGAADDRFGGHVAIHGDTIVIGTQLALSGRGAAYVFEKPPGGWNGSLTESAKLLASDGAANERFGATVAVHGGTVAVSAPWDNNFRGKAYVFEKPASGWNGTLTENARLIASDGKTGFGIGDVFGDAMAIENDTLVIGAQGADSPQTDTGAAYVFVKPAGGWTGTITERAKLIASDRDSNDRFGAAVAIREGTIAVGAPLDNQSRGSAYVFTTPAAGWSGTLTQAAKLVASDAAADDRLGTSVLVSGGTVIAGAIAGDSAQAADAGAAYAFERPAAGWAGTLQEIEKLTASDGETGDEFAASMALTGETLVVGARRDDIGTEVDQGSAYLLAEDLDADDDGVEDDLDIDPLDPASALTLTVTPRTATNPLNVDHCVTADVRGAAGAPAPGFRIGFVVNFASDERTTGADGRAELCYEGPAFPGNEIIAVHLDIDGDNAADPVDRADIVQATWILPESTPARAGGAGYVDSASGNNVAGFAFSATSSTEAGVNGQCILGDGEANVLLFCLNALIVTRTGTHLTMFGIAWINGQFDAYRVDADDLGPAFSGPDSFRIRLFNSSYTAGGVVRGGDVVVR